MDTVRETKRADELQPGDWIAAGPYNDRIGGTDDAEVLFVYRRSANAVSVTIQEVSIALPGLIDLHADAEITLLTAEEIANHKGDVERARKIADIRSLADWLEANPEVPMAYGIGGQADASESTSYSAAEIDAVRAFAERHGGEFREGKDHASARVRFGGVTYSLISWYKDGRPAELRPDPTGLAYSRADDADDPTPVSGARVEPHVGGLTDDGLVDETPAGPVHLVLSDGARYCGTPGPGTLVWREVTCGDCIGKGES